MGIAGYIRVARDEGNNEVELQKQAIEDYAKREEMTLSEFYIDKGFSGRDMSRPSFQKMITAVDKGNIEEIITKDYARIARDAVELMKFEDKLEEHEAMLYTVFGQM